MLGKQRQYQLLSDNCHQFTSGCVTGYFENSDNFFWMLKDTIENEMGVDTWRVWEAINGEYIAD